MTTTVVLADDQELLRTGLAIMIVPERTWPSWARHRTAPRAVVRAGETGCDVVVMDIRMPLVDGIEATQRIVADSDLACSF